MTAMPEYFFGSKIKGLLKSRSSVTRHLFSLWHMSINFLSLDDVSFCLATVATSCPALLKISSPRAPIFSSSLSFTDLGSGNFYVTVPGHFGAIGNAGEDIFLLKAWVLLEDFMNGHPAGKDIKNQGNPDSMPFDTGFAEADVGVDGYSFKQFFSDHHTDNKYNREEIDFNE